MCVGRLSIIDSDNGSSPGRRQAIIWTNAGILLIRPLGTNFSEILVAILTFSLKKMSLKVSSAKRRPFCLGLNVLIILWRRGGQILAIMDAIMTSYTLAIRVLSTNMICYRSRSYKSPPVQIRAWANNEANQYPAC